MIKEESLGRVEGRKEKTKGEAKGGKKELQVTAREE